MISVLVPAFNEEKNLRGAVTSIQSAAHAAGDLNIEIIIVNDGSVDGTSLVCDSLSREHSNVQCVQKKQNEGLAAAVRSALAIAKYPKFVSVPGSGDMQETHLEGMFRSYQAADVICSYYVNRELRGRLRNIVSAFFGTIYMSTFNVHVQYITGPVIYPTSLLRSFQLHSRGFSIFPEMTVKALRSGVTYFEVAGYMKEEQERSGTVSFKNLIEVVRTYFLLLWEIVVFPRPIYSHTPRRAPLPVGGASCLCSSVKKV